MLKNCRRSKISKGIKTAPLFQNLWQFCWISGFCLYSWSCIRKSPHLQPAQQAYFSQVDQSMAAAGLSGGPMWYIHTVMPTASLLDSSWTKSHNKDKSNKTQHIQLFFFSLRGTCIKAALTFFMLRNFLDHILLKWHVYAGLLIPL